MLLPGSYFIPKTTEWKHNTCFINENNTTNRCVVIKQTMMGISLDETNNRKQLYIVIPSKCKLLQNRSGADIEEVKCRKFAQNCIKVKFNS